MRPTLLLMSLAILGVSPSSASETLSPSQGQAKPADKMICKRQLKTGTLALYERSCHTRAEWEKIGDRWRETWSEMQGTKGSTHGN